MGQSCPTLTPEILRAISASHSIRGSRTFITRYLASSINSSASWRDRRGAGERLTPLRPSCSRPLPLHAHRGCAPLHNQAGHPYLSTGSSPRLRQTAVTKAARKSGQEVCIFGRSTLQGTRVTWQQQNRSAKLRRSGRPIRTHGCPNGSTNKRFREIFGEARRKPVLSNSVATWLR